MAAVTTVVSDTATILACAAILPGMQLGRLHLAVAAALLFSVILQALEPLILLLTMPLNVATFGVSLFFINGLLLLGVSLLLPGFGFTGHLYGIFTAMVVAAAALIVRIVIRAFLLPREPQST